MKKTVSIALVMALAISMLAACGDFESYLERALSSTPAGATASSSATASSNEVIEAEAEATAAAAEAEAAEVIHASALLSMEDAGQILDSETSKVRLAAKKVDEICKLPAFCAVEYMECQYATVDYSVNIAFYQDEVDYCRVMNKYMERETAREMEAEADMDTDMDMDTETPSGDIVERFVKSVTEQKIGDSIYFRHFDDGDTYSAHIFYDDYYIQVYMRGNLPNDETWVEAKVSELGKLALEHLKEILDGERSPESDMPSTFFVATDDCTVPKATDEIITPSMLITPLEAGAIVGEELYAMRDYKDVVMPGYATYIFSVYTSGTCAFMISIYQEALFLERGNAGILKEGDMAHIIEGRLAGFDVASNDPTQLIKMEGLGDAAYFLNQEGVWTLEVYYGAYWVNVVCGQNKWISQDKEEALEWQKERLLEAGELIVERLKGIIG